MSENEIKILKRKRGSLKAKLTHFANYVKGLETKYTGDEVEVEENDFFNLETRSNQAGLILQEYDELQSALEAIVDDDEIDALYDEREQFSNTFYSEISRGKRLLVKLSPLSEKGSKNSSHHSQQTTINADLSGFRLPPIEVPKFDGSFENWLEFRETFGSLVHTNNTLRNFQKFHYLKSSLLNNASQVIASIEFSEANYSLAWDSLCERYDNTRLLVHNHVKSLFNLEVKGTDSSRVLRFVIDSVSKHLKSLKQLNQPTEHWDTLIIYIITCKLDNTTAREWENYRSDKRVPTLEHLKIFLKSKADLMETLESKQQIPKFPNQNTNRQVKLKSFVTSENQKSSNDQATQNYTPDKPICAYCKKNHYIRNCAEYLKLSVVDRNETAKKLRLCVNCLRFGHINTVCRLSNCKRCNGRHNTLLHIPSSERQQNKHECDTESEVTTNEKKVSLVTCNLSYENVLLTTALVQVVGYNHKTYTVRALLDSASQSSFITSKLCDMLNQKTENVNMAVMGLNNATSKITKKCEITLQSQHSAYSVKLACLVINEITEAQPSMPININTLNIPNNILLADPEFYKPGPVNLLIGANLFWQLMSIGQIHLGQNQPILQKTTLGWIVSGCVSEKANINNKTRCNLSLNSKVQTQLAKFWELEECSPKSPFSKDELLCEQHFSENTKRDSISGRFVVSMPFKGNINILGDSEEQARNRFFALERKLKCKDNLREKYSNFMNEYKTLGHMQKIANSNKAKICYYMPHHGVLREESTTTKLRVVFDASASTSSGVSLNDLQLVGPTIQNSLIDILLRFRLHAFVITADIEKMYRQVLINPEQRQLQRIYWRSDPNENLESYELNTVTYGTASAPFLAIRCLVQLAQVNKDTYPEAAHIIENDFCVDDLLTGASTVDETAQIGLIVSKILSSACFKLRKWHSNSSKVLETMQATANSENIVEFGIDQNTKTLGLRWSCDTDNFLFSIEPIAPQGRVTKRVILSCIGQIFDPLGLLGPCIIIAKILLQKLWLERLSWDESVPTNIHSAWLKFKDEISSLNELNIPRHATCQNKNLIEIHGFSDASEQAYGACVYLRSIDKNEQVYSHLLCAKSKVAPLKVITIPKLELCAALLLAKLINTVQNALKISCPNPTLWTDSTIVLGWLKTEPHLLKTFSANRVSEIQELTSHCNWRHVPTKDNPADLLSRGVGPYEIKVCDLWWRGPRWLVLDDSNWPEGTAVAENLPELKSTTRSLIVKCPNSIINFNNFSSLNRLVRAVSYIFRFKTRILKRANETGVLKVHELENAYKFLISVAQKDSFLNEINALLNEREIDKKSTLLNLNPFIDSEGLLRVGGRLHNSEFSYDKKHPLIISSKHRFCKLIFKAEHIKLLHAGPQLLLSSIRDSLWPVSGRNLAKATVRECVTCFRFKPKPTAPIMGNLPKNRLDAGYPFKICGVDYAGPLIIKDRKGRGCKASKCYVALFVCFAVKAIHIELVSDLTTNTFLLALKRFISRRGKPFQIFSDNGSTFQGANNQLKALSQFINENENKITESCAAQNIKWHFIPPHSPHFGGIWEAGVKSCKHHLKRVVGNNTLTFEEMTTVLAQIEAVLNSRPISPLSTDPNDLNPLTPAHFLIGRSLTSTAEQDITQQPIGRLNRFQLLEQMRQNFWRRWSKEYVSELQQRVKWKTTQTQLVVGSMVLVKDDELSPANWKLGRIIDLHPGKDGVCRVASIRTVHGVIRRAFAKICPLPNGSAE